MMTVKLVESASVREALAVPRFVGVQARAPSWKVGVSRPAASRVAAELLRGSTPSGLVPLPAHHESLLDLLATNGWSRISSLLTPASLSVVLAREPGQARTRLTPRELEVSSFVARGEKSQHAGAALSIAAATARGATERALRKLGLASTVQLVLLWHTLSGSPDHFRDVEGAEWVRFQIHFASLWLDRLTESQRQIALGLMSGERIADVARRRAVSPRTISNQLASLFRRFHASSRGELILRLLDPAPPEPARG
jgi:DNA-binding NarL/FixJ family response regulator